MKNKSFPSMIFCLVASITVVSQTPTPTPIADETLRLCIASVQTKQFTAAVTDCGNAVKKSPANFAGYQGRGIAYFNLKNNDAALADFTKAIELAPKNPQLYGLRGEFYANAQKFDLALVDFNKILELSPNNQLALYRRAQIYSQTGKKDLAVTDLKAILAVNPNQAEAKTALAQLEATMKPFEFEGRKLSAPADFLRESDTVYVLSGAYAGLPFKQDDRNKYFNLLSNCVARFPDDYDCAKKLLDFYQKEDLNDLVPSQGGLGEIQTKFAGSPQAKWIEANHIPLYTAILKKDPKDTTAYSKRAARYLEIKNYDAAVADYTKIIALNPKPDIYYLKRSEAYLALRNYDLALADINQAFEITTNPTWKRIYQENRINIHLAAEKYDTAIADADQLLTKDPKNGAARLYRGIALRGQGKNDPAIAEFSTAIKDYPKFEQAYRERAATYKLAGKNDLAVADEREANRLKTGK